MKDWVEYFFDIAKTVAEKSKDPTTKVGAIVVNDSRRILATGFNGIPIGVADDKDIYPERYDRSRDKYLYVSHAEANVIAFAANEGVSLKGGTMYVTLHPCVECSKAIIMAGIKEVHCIDVPRAENREWTHHLDIARKMLNEAGVKLITYKTTN